MSYKLALVLSAVVGLLNGCSTPPLRGSVSRFHVLPAQPQTFAVIPDKGQSGSLEFTSYSNLVREALQKRGWREAGFENADVAVLFQYSISQGRQVAFSYPIFGQVPSGNSTTTGTVSTYGSTAVLQATTTAQTETGIIGTGVGSRVEFDRALRVLMYALPSYRSTQKLERVYEGEIRSTGSTGDLPTVMPVLVRGLLDDFPGTSGTTRRVRVPFQ
jgi:hypothetical protein